MQSFAKVTLAAGVEVKQAVNLPLLEAGDGAVGTEVAVGQQEVAGLEGGPQILEEGVFAGGIGR